MNELIVPPSPNWFYNSILACAPDNTVIYGARYSIVILQNSAPSEAADVKIIYQAHNDKVSAVSIYNAGWGNPDKYVVSVSADRIVKLWDIKTCSLVNQHKEHEKSPDKVMGVFMLKDRVVSVSESGYIINWRLATNSHLAMPDIFGQKVRIRCMSSCPHAPWRTAFGLHSGLVVVADLRQNGKVLYRMRGNEGEITSLSWCPATYNIFQTPQGILIENSLMMMKSWKNKYVDVDKKTNKQGKNKSDNQMKVECPIVKTLQNVNVVRITTETTDKKLEDLDTSQSELEKENYSLQEMISNESFKNIITSGENGDLDDGPAATNLEYKPKQRKKNIRKQKIDKKNPWGNVEFNNSDDEEQDGDGRACYLPAITDDFLGECLNLRNIILREDSAEMTEKETSSQIEETDDIKMQGSVTSLLEDGAGDSKVPEQNVDAKIEVECTNTKETQAIETTVKDESLEVLEGGSGDAKCSEVECKVAEVTEQPIITESETDKQEKDEIVNVPSGNVSSVTDLLEHLDISSSSQDVRYMPTTEYLLASACKSGIICIWRAGTDGRLQRQLQVVNKSSHKSKRSQSRNDKNSRWVSLCWVKPNILVSSSFTHEVYSWNLLPDIQNTKTLSKESIYKPRLIHSDHKRIVFTLASPYKSYTYEDQCADNSDAYVWSVSQDRWIFCTSLGKDRRMLACYPTLGSLVLNLAVSPVDPNKIAVGVADSSIRLWDLSKPHTRVITMTCLWDKIKSKVLHLDWHPKKENFVAFATAEGRVGEFDAFNISKAPVVFANYHSNPVFRVQWGPLPNCTDGIYGLYSSSNGELIVHDASKPTIEPKKVPLPKCSVSTFAWKSDYSVLAVGTKEGDVKLLSNDLIPYRTLYMQRKAVQCVAWHPLSTVTDVGLSPFANDLAVGTNDSIIFVYRCDEPYQSSEDEANTKPQLVAILQGHTQRVRNLAWCPHVAGRLASCSEDTTAIVWDVPSQTMLATFNDHCNDVIMSILWSPLDADLILTGGKDSTLRIWRVTKNPPNPLAVVDKKDKKKSSKPPKIEAEQNEGATGVTVVEKTSKMYVLPCVSKMQHPEHGFLMDTFHKLLHKIDHPEEVEDKAASGKEADSSEDEEEIYSEIGLPNFKIDPVQLFGSKDDTMKILEFERQTHMAKKRWDCAHHLALYKGDIGKSIRTALKAGVVNPWIISMAPMVSIRLWMKLCVVYAEKLVEEGDGLTASSYYLAVHQADRAIDALCKSNLHREALSLAKLRFPYDTDLITGIMERWAKYAIHIGNFEIASQCFISLGKFSKAGELLNRRIDVESLEMAAELAKRGNNQDLYDAVQTKLEVLKKQAPAAAEEAPPGDDQVVNISQSRLEAVLASCMKMLEMKVKEEEEEDTGTSSSSTGDE